MRKSTTPSSRWKLWKSSGAGPARRRRCRYGQAAVGRLHRHLDDRPGKHKDPAAGPDAACTKLLLPSSTWATAGEDDWLDRDRNLARRGRRNQRRGSGEGHVPLHAGLSASATGAWKITSFEATRVPGPKNPAEPRSNVRDMPPKATASVPPRRDHPKRLSIDHSMGQKRPCSLGKVLDFLDSRNLQA